MANSVSRWHFANERNTLLIIKAEGRLPSVAAPAQARAAPGSPRYDRDFLLSPAKRNQVIELREVEQFGRDSFGDPDAVSFLGHEAGRMARPRRAHPGNALSAERGLDLGRTKPPIAEIVADIERVYRDDPVLTVIEVHEHLVPEPLAALR